MKKWLKSNIILILCVIVGIFAAAFVLSGRIEIENDSKTYDIVMDLESVELMSKQSDKSLEYWLKFFRSQGVDKLAVSEDSLAKIASDTKNKVYLKYVGDISGEYDWESKYPKSVVEMINSSQYYSDMLIITADAEMYQWIMNAFDNRADGIKYKTYSDGDTEYLWLYGQEDKVTGETWAHLPLGILPDELEMYQKMGYEVIPRSTPVKGTNGIKYAKALYADMEKSGASYFVPAGTMLPGYDDEDNYVEELNKYLDKTGAGYVVVETSNQSLNLVVKGADELIESRNYTALRMFTMWNYIQANYEKYGYEGPEEITNCIYRAVYERNCSLVYLKMIAKDSDLAEYITDEDDYVALLSGLHDRMSVRGFTYGTVETNEAYEASFVFRIIIGVGAIAASVMLLGLFVTISVKFSYGLFILGVIAMAGATYVAPNLSKLLLNIGGGIVLPSLAAVGFNRISKKLFTDGKLSEGFLKFIVYCIIATLGLFIVSFVGAIYAAAPLSETSYMLEMQLYRGVKIMQLIPLCIYALSFTQVFLWDMFVDYLRKKLGKDKNGNDKTVKTMLREYLDCNIKVRNVVIAVALLILAILLLIMGKYYIERTGNSAVGVSSLEIRFRNYLEEHFAARPRTKEFLFGYPCIMLALWCLRKKLPLLSGLFGAGAVIGGYVSVVNTFLHIRTKFAISVERELTGLGFGLVLGIIAVVIFEILYKLILRAINSKKAKGSDDSADPDEKKNNATAKTATAIGGVMLLTMLSKVFGILRESVQAGVFGVADAFCSGYNKTIYLFTTVSYALCIAAVPIITKDMAQSREKGEKTANTLTSFALILSLAVVAVIELITFTPLKGVVFGNGEELVSYVRIMALSLPVIVCAYQMVATFQSMDHYTLQGTMSLPYSVLLIGYLLLFGAKLPMYVYVIMVAVAWALQLLMSVPYGVKEKYLFRPTLDFKQDYLKIFLKTAIVTIISGSMNLFCYLLDASVAEKLGEGVTSAFYYADKLYTPLTTTFIYSIGTVMFPKLNREFTKTNKTEYLSYVWGIVSNTLVAVFPVCALFTVFGGNVLKVLFNNGNFTQESTLATATVFSMYALGMAGFGCIDLLNKSFFTMNRSLPPLLISLSVVVINLVLNTLFGTSGAILALTTSISITLGGIAAVIVMFKGERIVNILEPIKSLGASAIIGAISYILRGIVLNGGESKIMLVLKCGSVGAVAMVVFVVLCYVLKIKTVTDILGSKLKKA